MNAINNSSSKNMCLISVNSILYPMDMVRERELNVPIFQKQNLTIEEAAVYSNIGQHKLRELTADERCPFVLWVGNKRLIKRRQFDEYMARAYSI